MLSLKRALSSVAAITMLSGCAQTSSTSSGATTKSHLGHEQQWLVGSVGRDIAKIILFAAKRAHPEIDMSPVKLDTTESKDGGYSYSLKWNQRSAQQATAQVKISKYLWNPQNYVAWVSQLETTTAVKPTEHSQSAPDVIATLANFSPMSLAKVNEDLSAALTSNPLDPNTNEQAALLCTLYALRETAACFTDSRHWLSRISAHLALSNTSADGKLQPGIAGRLSNIGLLSLSGRTHEALGLIDAMLQEHPSAVTASWLRALKIRTTHDFRLLDNKAATLIERLEYGRALSNDLSADAMTDYLQRGDVEKPSIDWMRLGMRGIASVEAGHIYAMPSVQAEIGDAVNDAKLAKRLDKATSVSLQSLLGDHPTDCIIDTPQTHAQVVSWGDLADFHNRHLLDAVFQTYHFMQKMWGVKHDAKEFAETANKTFRNLPLYPLCQMDMVLQSEEKVPHEIINRVAGIIKTTPEYVNCDLWTLARNQTTSDVVPNPEVWFDPVILTGTTFDYENRCTNGPRVKLVEMEKLHELNPFNRTISYQLARIKTHKPKPDELAALYEPIMEYDIHAMTDVRDAAWPDLDTYTKYQESLCKFDGDAYFHLGSINEDKSPQKALAAYEKALQVGRNQVLMSNSCTWLVNYYYDHGQPDKAMALAKQVAEVYSAEGLATMARLCDRMKKTDEAEKWFKAIDERYETQEQLCAFYLRHANEKEEYKRKGEELLHKLSPSGLQKLDPTTLNGAPHRGLRITSTTIKTEAAGLPFHSIIVGVNGYRVETIPQLSIAREIPDDPTVEFVAWVKDQYKTVHIYLPTRRLNCGLSEVKH